MSSSMNYESLMVNYFFNLYQFHFFAFEIIFLNIVLWLEKVRHNLKKKKTFHFSSSCILFIFFYRRPTFLSSIAHPSTCLSEQFRNCIKNEQQQICHIRYHSGYSLKGIVCQVFKNLSRTRYLDLSELYQK